MLTFLFLVGAILTGVVKEPVTGVEFSDTLKLTQGTIACTGADCRKKYFVKAYAIAHYGSVEAWPKSADPKEQLKDWIDAPVLKACVLSMTYDVPCDRMKTAIAEGLDRAGYKGAHREAFLANFSCDLKKGDEFRFVAEPNGTLITEYNGTQLSKWVDADAVRALWTNWLGDISVLENRENLVKQPAPKTQ